ncbi:ATP-binding cassette sub-family C member 2-like [Rhipicephalus microplus]|uniref:ATP-binding cassette sub-family C member 2-like n=1 Tax=Rhipicephalus microplus TaxID=6941 RepID=UPI003F6A9523
MVTVTLETLSVDVEKRAADQGDSGDSLLVAPAALDDSWPSKGLVKFEKYSASYRPGTLPDVLKGVTFVVKPHEKVDVEKRAADQGDSGDSLLVAPAALDDSWPSKGLVEFEKYSASYRPGTLPDVLKGVTFVVEPHEKVGVVGRTGAGKSSLVLALLSVLRASRGRILIDSVDVSTVPLRKLRSAITVIPQDPSLVRGSLWDNLDPTRSHSDAQLWTAPRQAHLSDVVAGRQEGLLLETGDGGSNFSVGQRPLVCLARALLRGPKILVLDEATSQMDGDTDHLIQATLRDAFAECAVIAIAHRIHTVFDYDKILVMSEGTVLEYGPVKTLLSDTTSAFYAMARNAGALPFDVQCPDIAASAGR